MLGWLTEFEVLPLVIRGDCIMKGGLEHREEVSYEVKEHPESGKSQQAEDTWPGSYSHLLQSMSWWEHPPES